MSVYNIKGEEIGGSISSDVKNSLLKCFRAVPWTNDNDIDDCYNQLRIALESGNDLNVTFSPNRNIYNIDTLEGIKKYITLTNGSGDIIPRENYTLSGALTVGTSTITINYDDLALEFDVSVKDAFELTGFDLSFAEMMLLNGQGNLNTNMPSNIDFELKNTRRIPLLSFGKVPFYLKSDSSATTYYPLPVLKDAKTITISVTPSSQYLYPNVIYLPSLESEQKYWSISEKGWTQGTTTIDISSHTDIQYKFLWVNVKYDSAGTSYPTQPSAINISYSK